MKKVLALLFLVALFAGCATGGPRSARYPNAATPEMQSQYKQAEQLYMEKRFVAADGALVRFISESPYTELTDEARFLRGEIAFIKKDYAGAVKLYRESYSEISSPNIEPKSRFKAGLSFYRMQKPTEALGEISGIRRAEASATLRLRIDSLGANASINAGTRPISWYLWLLDDYAEGATPPSGVPEEKIVPEAEALAKAKAWVDDPKITTADAETLPLKDMKGKRSGGFALYKLAMINHRSGNTDEATKLLRAYISNYPKHEYYGQARMLMTELGGAVGESAGIAVGVVLPLSGRFGVYGESVLHGIECAIGLYEPCIGPSGMRIVVRDTASSPGAATAAVADLAQDKDLLAIIGPLESSDALAAAQRAQELGIPLVSLSQKEGVAEVGEYTFKNSVSTSSEMGTLAKYAVHTKGYKRFFVLAPNNKKAAEYVRLFQDAVKAEGGRVVASKTYSPSQIQPMNELRGRGAAEQAAEQAPTQANDFTQAGAAYDAIFIPDASWAAAAIAQMISVTSSEKVNLLG
ncbi:MAG: penicillin-binding protein activator, partial [bacterium]